MQQNTNSNAELLLGLGVRLSRAAVFVRRGSIVADIGCDHAKLAVCLIKNNIAAKVIAIDINEEPLKSAKRHISANNCEGNIECRLGNGLLPLCANEASDIVIAGLSGETICEILNNAPWVKNKNINIILVPSSSHTRLRRKLYQNGFEIKCEVVVLENKRVYTVMQVNYCGNAYTPSELFCTIGKICDNKSYEAKLYIEKKLRHLTKKTAALKTAAQTNAHNALICEVKACLALMK
jgi:tRNA (adenine22-N1)-methyltransferase